MHRDISISSFIFVFIPDFFKINQNFEDRNGHQPKRDPNHSPKKEGPEYIMDADSFSFLIDFLFDPNRRAAACYGLFFGFVIGFYIGKLIGTSGRKKLISAKVAHEHTALKQEQERHEAEIREMKLAHETEIAALRDDTAKKAAQERLKLEQQAAREILLAEMPLGPAGKYRLYRGIPHCRECAEGKGLRFKLDELPNKILVCPNCKNTILPARITPLG